MPRLGETMEHGIVVEWFVKEGESFNRGDPIIEFETDKTAVEYPALGDGVLIEQLVRPGDQVNVGEPLATIDFGQGPDWLSDVNGAESARTEGSSSPMAPTMEGGAPIDSGIQQDGTIPEERSQLRATPAARKRARELRVTLTSLPGTGRRGRVEVHDVEAAAELQGRSGMCSSIASNTDNATEISAARIQYADGIAYSVSGPPSGMQYLLLHGFAADSSAWRLLGRALANAGCRVIVVDLPGHGATKLEGQDAASLSVGLQSVLAANNVNSQPWHVIAHSLGTVPALKLAQTQSHTNDSSDRTVNRVAIASLSLIAPIGLGLSIDAQFVQGMASPSSAGEISHLLRRLSDRPSSLSTQAVEALYTSLKRGRLVKLAESLLGVHGQRIDNHDAIQAVSSEIPVRIIIGHADRIIDWRDMMRVSPAVAIHHFPNAGHMPHWDQPKDVAEIILASQKY